MSRRRYTFSEDGLRRAIAEGWANQTSETAWLDDACQPIPEVVANAILASIGSIGTNSPEWWTPERRTEASAAWTPERRAEASAAARRRLDPSPPAKDRETT